MMKKFEEALWNLTEEKRIFKEEPMAKHTTFRVGGQAEYYLMPDRKELPEVIRCCGEYQIPYLVIGNGSNLLVSDKGIRGAVIEIGKNISAIRVEEGRIYAEAGALLSKTAHTALEHGLTGMEFAAGIPGCMGGAVVMNAGAYGGEMKDIIASVTVLTKQGEEKKLRVEELDLSYRHSCIPQQEYLVLEAELALQPGKQEEIRARMEELKAKRNEKQPLEYPSAGSTFKRPSSGYAAALIEQAGLKGVNVGDAEVSVKHSGFIVNKGNASCKDVLELIDIVKQKVYENSGIQLECEVRIVN